MLVSRCQIYYYDADMSPTVPQPILIVEDDLALADLLSKALQSISVDLTVIHNGNEVIPLTKSQPFALILLDIDLPGRDGFSLLEELRNDPDYKLIPILMLTNHAELSFLQKSKQLGATDYLIKANINYHTLHAVVTKYLDIG